jgi:hypothetical protein
MNFDFESDFYNFEYEIRCHVVNNYTMLKKNINASWGCREIHTLIQCGKIWSLLA